MHASNHPSSSSARCQLFVLCFLLPIPSCMIQCEGGRNQRKKEEQKCSWVFKVKDGTCQKVEEARSSSLVDHSLVNFFSSFSLSSSFSLLFRWSREWNHITSSCLITFRSRKVGRRRDKEKKSYKRHMNNSGCWTYTYTLDGRRERKREEGSQRENKEQRERERQRTFVPSLKEVLSPGILSHQFERDNNMMGSCYSLWTDLHQIYSNSSSSLHFPISFFPSSISSPSLSLSCVI